MISLDFFYSIGYGFVEYEDPKDAEVRDSEVCSLLFASFLNEIRHLVCSQRVVLPSISIKWYFDIQ